MKVLYVIIGSVAAVLVCAVLLLNTSYVQSWLLRQATDLLTEKLNTRVSIDSVSMSLFTQDLTLYGISIDDLGQQPLVNVQQVSLDLALSKLIHREVVVEEASVTGLDARLISAKKSNDSVANYQFLIDAFKKEPKGETSAVDSTGKSMAFDLHRLCLKDINLSYDDAVLALGEAEYTGRQLLVDRLRFTTDNHLPRKNSGHPHRGYFDVGHLDITMNMKWDIRCLRSDSIACSLTQCSATDSITGIDLTDLRLSLEANKDSLSISNMVVQQTNTAITVPRAFIRLPSKKRHVSLSYTADSICGSTVLKDISRPFSPALKDFTIPLNLSLNLSGTDSTMAFSNVKVSTDDRKLTIAAAGTIDHLKEAHRLAVRFRVSRMHAKNGIKEKIISQFPVKKYMMKQLHRLGDISYTGSFAVLWRREEFQGNLQTAGGSINFSFALDDNGKYLFGKVSSTQFQLGDVMEIKHLGPVACHADFTFDYSKPRTALMRREKGGKLPIGTVNAVVDECSYHGVRIKNLSVNMKSDGAEATGDVIQQGKHRDIYFSFSFTDTDEMQKMKILKPGIKFHKALKQD